MTQLFDAEVQQLRRLYGEEVLTLSPELVRNLYSEWCIPERFAAHFTEEPFVQTPEAVRLSQLLCAYIQVVPAENYLSFDFMNEHLTRIGLASIDMGSNHPLVEMSYSSNSGFDASQNYERAADSVIQAATYLKSVLARVTPKYDSSDEQRKARENISIMGWAMQGAFWSLMPETVVFPEDLVEYEVNIWAAGKTYTENLFLSLERELAPYEAAARRSA